ncbi:MAG: thiamine diphosphokinase [Anaerolineaceae bacterium]|nr:thiamine diphosphokinase [Anaerolineaceae bacterium]
MSIRRAVIFANGELPDSASARALLEDEDVLIASDGGLGHLERIGLRPSVLIGDLDSVTPDQVERVRRQGGDVLQYPVEKNETDLELAIQYALDNGFRRVLIMAALGGRLDHLLGNLSLLTRPGLEEVDLRLDDGQVEAFLITDQAMVEGAPGDLVSLIPLWGAVQGVVTRDLQYPLRAETLYPFKTRGISNVMEREQAGVSIAGGQLLCIHTRQGSH